MLEDFWKWLATLPPGSASFIGTLTGSSFGLLAILAGALFNARLNRKRDERLREEERIALASSLYAELAGIHRTMTTNSQRLTESPPDGDEVSMIPRPTIKILPEVQSKFGLLKSDTVRNVIDAYIVIEQYLDMVILIGGTLRQNMPERRELAYIGAAHSKNVVTLNQGTADHIKTAMDALIPYLK